MPELILRLEQQGRTLGEWTLTGGPLSLTLRDPSTGETVATFRATVPTAAPAGESHHEGFDAPTEASAVPPELDLDAPATEPGTREHYDEIGVVGLSADGEPDRIPGDDFTMPNPEPTDPSRANRNLSLIGAAYAGDKTATMSDLEGAPAAAPAASRSMMDETTYVRPQAGGGSSTAASSRSVGAAASGAAASGAAPEPLLEVWFYKNGQWVRRGWLSSGQRASLRGGVIRCTRGGSLLVSPGTWFTVSAVLPSGKQVQVEPGSKPVRLPSGSAVTLWDGERGLHVRDVETADEDARGQRSGDRYGGERALGARP